MAHEIKISTTVLLVWLIFRFLTEFWRSWKNSFREDTLFLKRFDFCISFNNFLTDICVDQVFLKNLGSQSGKKFEILRRLPKISRINDFYIYSLGPSQQIKIKTIASGHYICTIWQVLHERSNITVSFTEHLKIQEKKTFTHTIGWIVANQNIKN